MTQEKLPPPTVIDTLPDLESLSEELADVARVGIDVESDGFYVYHEKVCLLQLSTVEEDFVIDPLAVQDLSPLGPMFRDPRIEKVFHAAEYDVLCLKRDFGFHIRNIFDTMAASRTLGVVKLGLANVIEEHFGIRLSKKLQRANWGKRPLSREQLEYARLDTHYLLDLSAALLARLEDKGLLKDARDEFERLERLEPNARRFDPDAFWNLPGARKLSPQARAVLKELYIGRERRAAELDRAPFRVLPEELLVRLAEVSPASSDALRQFRGMTPYLFTHFQRDILDAVRRGLSAPPIDAPPARPANNRWSPMSLRRYEALRRWRKAQAESRGVSPIVVLSTDEIRRLAHAPDENPEPAVWLDCLSEYKRGVYGEQLLPILHEKPSGRPRRKK